MANLQVKNVPDEVHAQLRALAEREGRSLRDVVLDAVRQALARDAFRQQLASRSEVELDLPASELLQAARRDREELLGG